MKILQGLPARGHQTGVSCCYPTFGVQILFAAPVLPATKISIASKSKRERQGDQVFG
jgi:hypothetical protein